MVHRSHGAFSPTCQAIPDARDSSLIQNQEIQASSLPMCHPKLALNGLSTMLVQGLDWYLIELEINGPMGTIC
jgi:hypothetical protein